MRPDHEKNIKKISDGHVAKNQELTAADLVNGKVTMQITVVDDDGNEQLVDKNFDIGFITMHSSAKMSNLKIKSMYTTSNEDSSNKGAISITCVPVTYDEQAKEWVENGPEVTVRTAVLKDEYGNLITEDRFPVGSIINAQGIVDYYNGYQLKVFSINDIVFVEKAEQ